MDPTPSGELQEEPSVIVCRLSHNLLRGRLAANVTRLVRHFRDNLAYQMAPLAIGLLKDSED